MVTTNEHLLQEINSHKKEIRNASNKYPPASNDHNNFSPTHSHQETPACIYLPSNGQSTYPKPTIKKQFDQLNNNINTRYSYSYVK